MRRLVALALVVAPFACSGGSLVMAPMLASSVAVEVPSAAPALDAGPSQDVPNLTGRWSGRGQQSDGQGWEIVLDVAGVGASLHARVTYPALSCGGEWNLEPTTVREWVGDEHIAYGTDRCIENGVVHVRLTDAGVLEFDWREIGGRGSTARGTLRRGGARR
jgi:hypothetical protein